MAGGCILHVKLSLIVLLLLKCFAGEIERIDTYPSSSSASISLIKLTSYENGLHKKCALTKIFWVGVDPGFSFLVQQEPIHLNVHHQHVGCSKLHLLCLYHEHLTSKHCHLTEIHMSLHSGEVFERPSWKFASLVPVECTSFETLMESSTEKHFLFTI